MRDVQIMDIAMNLARIGNWAADDFDGKKKRIHMFLEQTNEYLTHIDVAVYPVSTQQTIARFSQVFDALRAQTPLGSKERLRWADDMLTWSTILTHRASVGK